MPSVDRPIAASTSPSLAQPPNMAASNKQTWLKALEEAGLRNALRATKQFGSSESSRPASQDRRFDKPPARQENHGRYTEGETPSWNGSNHGVTADSGLELTSGDAANADTDRAAARRFTPATGIFAPAGQEILTESSGSVAVKVSTPATMTQPKWQPRNMTVLQSGEGVEVWLRDATLTQSDLVTLLAGLRNSMAELGTSLVRVSLNGKPVHSFNDQGDLGERQSKEG